MKYIDKERGGVHISTSSMAGLLPTGASPTYALTKAANIHFTRAMASKLEESNSRVKVYCLCPSYTETALGPPVEFIRAALGGVLRADHMAEGFMLLAEGNLPNGSIMRFTLRNRGKYVVHDLVRYGKEFGGSEKKRDGKLVKKAILAEQSSKL